MWRIFSAAFAVCLLGCPRTLGEEPFTFDAAFAFDARAETAWEDLLELEASGRFRTAFLRAGALPGKFPGTVQAEWALRKRGELLERLRLEVGDTLRSLGTAERSFYQEKDAYTTDLTRLWWFYPNGRPAYTYGFLEPCASPRPPYCCGYDGGSPHNLTSDPELQRGLDPSEMVPLDTAQVAALLAAKGLTSTVLNCGRCPDCGFLGVAVSNLDMDPDPDVWVIGTNLAVEHVVDDLRPDGGP